ncbi:MAG: tyrosine-type recombinase/integrase [Lentisphaeria bacterium]|nr:tyrosine-type recombinase/integrase [Lentisphaeria bacterium]
MSGGSMFLTKVKGSARWYVAVKRKVDGKWKKKVVSTGTTDREVATRLYLEPMKATMDGRKEKERVERALSAAGAKVVSRRVALDAVWELYLRSAEVSAAPRQVRDRENKWGIFRRWLELRHPEIAEIREIAIREVAEFWKWLAEDGKSPHTRNRYRSQLKVLWDGVAVAAELTTNPWTLIQQDRGVVGTGSDLSMEQVRDLVAKARDYVSRLGENFWACAIMMGVETGLRQGDIATLEYDELLEEDGYLVLRPNKTKRWGRDRVAVHSLDRDWVRLLPRAKGEGFVWPMAAKASGKHWRALSEEFRELCELCGIETKRAPEPGERRKESVKLVTFHSLRHTFATHVLRSGEVTKQDLVAQGNWSNERVLDRVYNHAKLDLAKAAADKVAKVLPVW